MGRIAMFNRVAADGSFATPDDSLDWVVPEEELDKGIAEGMPDTGTIMFGRRTYDMFESFWPHVTEDSPGPHRPDSSGPETLAMARFINNATKLVFSRTRKDFPWENSRLLGEFDPAAVKQLKGETEGDIMIFGSGSIVTQLAEHGLIDEYRFVLGPILLGEGRPLFEHLPKTVRLELLEAKPYPSGNVVLRYGQPG